MIITIDGRPWMHWYYWRDISWCRIWTFFDIHEGEARTHCVSNRPILDVVRGRRFCINRGQLHLIENNFKDPETGYFKKLSDFA